MKFRLVLGAALIVGALPAFGLWMEARRGQTIQAAPAGQEISGEHASRPDVAVRPTLLAHDPMPLPTVEAATVAAPAATAAAPVASAEPADAQPVAETAFYEPAGCRAPPEDYSRVRLNGWWLNRRTLAMLQTAADLYDGPIDILGTAITQGSYSDAGWGRFRSGSHLGGGVVDLSVIPPHAGNPLYHEIGPLIKALRVAGFAAWLRDRSELFMGPDPHIHAIAIGDAETSPQALDELTGPFGYFRGFTGMAGPDGAPVDDPQGGPIVCRWMRAAGYADLNPSVAPAALPPNWRERLKTAADAYVANSVGETYQVAYRLDWLAGKTEDPSLMCGPLTAAILRDAGLLPAGIGPLNVMSYFWLPKPRENGRPWSYFPARDYDLYQYDTAINLFDFVAWPLLPADIVYTYQGYYGFEHIFVVTEVDAQGRAYTVTNYQLLSGSFIVQRVLLYDPGDPALGTFKTDWVQDRRLGRTGMSGFDVLRQKGATLPAGAEFSYVVEPGDTLQSVLPRFRSDFDFTVAANRLAEPYALQVGQRLVLNVGELDELPAAAQAAEPTPAGPELPYDVMAFAKVVLRGATAARIRFQPNGVILAAVPDGAPVQVLYGREEAGGMTWLQVRLEDGLTGWMADFLLEIIATRPDAW